MFRIIHIDANGNRDSYMAGDPTEGAGINEFVTRDEAEEMLESLDTPSAGCEWRVVATS